MGVFGDVKINSAKISGGGVYILPGEYVFEIEAFKVIKTRGKGPMFVAEFKVLETTNPERPIGSRPSFTVLVDQDWGPGNLKEFIVAASGLDPSSARDEAKVNAENWDAVLEKAINAQSYSGMKVICSASEQAKKKSEGSFTKIRFYPHPETRAHFEVD